MTGEPLLQLVRTAFGNQAIFMVFNMKTGKDVSELTNYAVDLSVRNRLSPLTIDKRIRYAMDFWQFLESQPIRLEVFSPSDACKFRDTELIRVLQDPASRGHELTAKRTVNDKLQAAKLWLAWLERSGLARECASAFDQVFFVRVGSGSKHKTTFALNEDKLDALRSNMLAAASSEYLIQRNSLIVDIANTVGFRRASINSLLTSQFDRKKLERTAEETFLVRPPSQKFDYQLEFPVPVWLGLRVCDFISEYRDPLVKDKRATAKVHQGRLFLSSRDACPLTNRAITQLLSTHIKDIGAPKGTSIHSLRRKFTNDRIATEIEQRLRRGMDTSTMSIAKSVSMSLGQTSPESIYPYVSRAQSFYDGSKRDKER
ncbi:MAG: hypothetical protein Tsb007_37470 [Rhizobacter sp.]